MVTNLHQIFKIFVFFMKYFWSTSRRENKKAESKKTSL